MLKTPQRSLNALHTYKLMLGNTSQPLPHVLAASHPQLVHTSPPGSLGAGQGTSLTPNLSPNARCLQDGHSEVTSINPAESTEEGILWGRNESDLEQCRRTFRGHWNRRDLLLVSINKWNKFLTLLWTFLSLFLPPPFKLL